MGWKVNLQPKLIAESLRKEAWTIGLKREKQMVLLSLNFTFLSSDSKLFLQSLDCSPRKYSWRIDVRYIAS